ncbi:MAG: M56 family metallopeptidase [Dehalobacterium sp.]
MNILQDLFITILNMSITASFAVLGVILMRLPLRKAPKVFSYVLWIAVFFRLICPFSFTSDLSFLELVNPNNHKGTSLIKTIPYDIGLMPAPAIQSGISSIDNTVNASLPQAIPVASVNPMQIWMSVLSLIWITGVMALLVYSVVSYMKVKGRLETATLVEGNVYETDTIGTAFVCGFIHPKIFVPVGVGNTDLSYILEHERMHIRRRDYLIKPLAFLALILHWFNPLVWLSFALMSRDMEMSCDENVLNRLGDDVKVGYSGSLLSLSVKRKRLLTLNPLAFGESHVKARIKNVLNHKKPAFWIVLILVIAVFCVGFTLMANPADTGTPQEKPFITWNAVKSLAEGSLTYQELYDTYYYRDLGSGLYIISFPIEGAESYALMISFPHDMNEEPMAVRLISEDHNMALDLNEENLAKMMSLAQESGENEAITGIVEKEIEKIVEENLSVIMSSPNTSSNPQDYINAHSDAYENIIKFGGENALNYMLAQFEAGKDEGLRGHLMMRLCKELLGARNNVTDESLSPKEWYAALSLRQEVKLPDFTYNGNDPIEKLVYATEIAQSATQRGFTAVAPKIFGSYEEDSFLRVFVTTYSASFKLYGNVLDDVGGSVIPSAITYEKDDNGNYTLKSYEQARDGSEFAPSIRKLCTMPASGREIPGLAAKILNHYGSYDDLHDLMWENLALHLRTNGITDATLKNSRGEIEFSINTINTKNS